jgi:hypothetical protein
MLAVPVCRTQVVRIYVLKIFHPSIGLSISCRCIVGFALHEIQCGVNKPEGTTIVRQFSVALLTLQYFILLMSVPCYFSGSADIVLHFGYLVSCRFNCIFLFLVSSRYILKVLNFLACDAMLTGK